MFFQQRLRTSILCITCFGVFVACGKLILFPPAARQFAPAAFEFPAAVPLSGWQLAATRPLEQEPNNQKARQNLLSGKLYSYQQTISKPNASEQNTSEPNASSLQIEMRYTIDTSGNVLGFLRNYTSVSLAAVQPSLRDERHREGMGYYLVFVDQQRAYLTSCINPRGDSTVTLPQFRHNRYTYDMRADRIFHWLLNAEGIRDDRCLWVNMSTSLEKNPPQVAYSRLENAWSSWYHWWQPRFPQL